MPPATPKKRKAEVVPNSPEPEQEKTAVLAGSTAHGRAVARMVAKPSTNAAAVMTDYCKQSFGEQSIASLADALDENIGDVVAGDMKQCESMLVGQAYALQSMFMSLARRAAASKHLPNTEALMRMALRAQNQCRMTLETLATVKNPPVVFAKQMNVANGPQQINNGIVAPGIHAHTGNENCDKTNELLEGQHGEWLDGGAQGQAGGSDKAMAAVGEINRTAHR